MRSKVSLLALVVGLGAALAACAPEGNLYWQEDASNSPDGATASRPAFFTSTLQFGNDAILNGTGGAGFVLEAFVVPPPSIAMRCNTKVYGPGGNIAGDAPEDSRMEYCRSFTRAEWRGSGTYRGAYWARLTIMTPGWFWYRIFKNPACYTGPDRIVAVCDGNRYQYFGPNGEMRTAKASPLTTKGDAQYLVAVPKACVALSPRALRRLHPNTKCARKLAAHYTPAQLKQLRRVVG